MNNTRHFIIQLLNQDRFISGNEIGDILGISRSAVAKHINVLSDMGLNIFRVHGKGYKLHPKLELLDADAIIKELKQAGISLPLEAYTSIDSTSDKLLSESDKLTQFTTCASEYQSKGRGRRGRQWQSPFGSHLYFSTFYQLQHGVSQAMGLSLVVAVSIANTISRLFNIEVGLKWPNDLYLNGKKFAGILIDLQTQSPDDCSCVIGIGLNIKMPCAFAEKIDQPWTDLTQHIKTPVNRSNLLAQLLIDLIQALTDFSVYGVEHFLQRWHQSDIFLSQQVVVITGDVKHYGKYLGVNEQGAMRLQTSKGEKLYYGGEVSLRQQS